MPVFTTKYNTISNQLINETNLIYGKKNIVAKSQWDTEASSTCISHEVVKKLGLIPTSKTKVLTPSGNIFMNVYKIDVVLPSKVLIRDVLVCESEIGDQGIDTLIGMNIINLGDFAVSNYNNKTYFSFRVPSKKHIDFVTDQRKENIINKSHKKSKK